MNNKKANQTFVSFRDKWEKNADLAFSETVREGSDIFNWILNRNGFPTSKEFGEWLKNRQRILDAGCGNGRVIALLRKYASESTEIVGIDLTSVEIARKNIAGFDRVSIQMGDLLGDIAGLGYFDLIYCQEVLHHTSNPRKAFLNLCRQLNERGEIAIYVYKKKAPLREYADDYVRGKVSGLPYEQAIKAMQAITELGRVLSDLNIKVNIPDVHVLGIDAGEYDVQRFLYHFFMKCFWNPSLSFDDNVAINYDWYHPQLCSRHTLEEVESWYADAGLNIIHAFVDHYGITIRGAKN